jgi:hypothetical protein
MSSKLGVKPHVKFLLAEDVRQEAMGKISLLGVLPGERFLVSGPPPTFPPGFPSPVFVVPSLAFVFIVSDLGGNLAGRFSIVAPDGKTDIAKVDMAVPGQKNSPTVAFSIARPFAGPSFGEYTIRLEIGTHRWKFALTIDKAPDTTQTPAKAAKAKARKRTGDSSSHG